MGAGLAYRTLRPLERKMVARSRPTTSPLLFILGLPRSGTTLVYQYIVHRRRVAYLTNGVSRFPYAPCFTTWYQTRAHRRYRSDFSSRFGKVAGAVAPCEAGAFWGRFFHPDDYQSPGDLSSRTVAELQAVISSIQRIHGGRPFVNKNVKHMQRLDLLADIFENARFLVVSRPMGDVAISLLRARYRLQGDPSRWWSVRPPEGFAQLRRKLPADQVAGQIEMLTKRLEADLGRMRKGKVFRLEFEAFCAHPDSVIDLLEPGLGTLEEANPPVERFQLVRHQPRDAEEEQLLAMVNHD